MEALEWSFTSNALIALWSICGFDFDFIQEHIQVQKTTINARSQYPLKIMKPAS